MKVLFPFIPFFALFVLGISSSAAPTGAGQSQLVSYAGTTYLIQPATDGSTPLITAVAARTDSESPSLVPAPGESSPSHSLSYATR